MATDRETEMKRCLQGIIDSTDELIEVIGRMDWERIEALGTDITSLAHNLKVLSRVS
mgnify:CR=1 FL=1